MSIVKDEFYRLISIKDLNSIKNDTLVQVIGKVVDLSEEDNRIIIDDTSGKMTTFVELKGTEIVQDSVVRVFGVFDGITLKTIKVLKWDIDFKDLETLQSFFE